jgi:2-amino-4-hydroxy-6-hydroxymethyldihydropteridine diphosphokinase
MLRFAHDRLPDVVRVSRVFETEPIGGPEGQGAYLNAVVELFTESSARALLEHARKIEAEAGRVRLELNGPRTLDIDILLVGQEVIAEGDLEVPHPRMWERRFVLEPLADLAPELLPAGWETRAVGQVEAVGSL